jgi:hypothetical protein
VTIVVDGLFFQICNRPTSIIPHIKSFKDAPIFNVSGEARYVIAHKRTVKTNKMQERGTIQLSYLNYSTTPQCKESSTLGCKLQ